MKEADVDQQWRQQLDTLEQVPDIDWDEERGWQRIQKSLGFNYYGGLSLLGLLLLSLTAWLYFSLYPQEKVAQTPPPGPISAQAEKPMQEMTSPAAPAEAPKKVYHSEQQPAKAIAPVAAVDASTTAQVQDEVARVSGKSTTAASRPTTTGSGATMPITARYAHQKAPVPDVSAAIPTQKQETEIVYHVRPHSRAIGLNSVRHLSPRFSILYGLHVKQFQPYITNRERPGRPLQELQVPLQLRYYLLPRENRFTSFLYAGLLGQLVLDQGIKQPQPQLGFDSGLEMRYRFYQGEKGKAAYLFLRMPLYQRNMHQGFASPALFNRADKE